MIYELAIAVKDEADLPSGHKRKKEGDIIAVRPRERKSTTEVDRWEYKQVNQEMKNVPIMKDIDEPISWGRKEIDQYLIVVIEDDSKNLRDKLENVKGKNGEKNRYTIPLADLKTNYCNELDLSKVRDKKVKYQPFRKASDIVLKFDDIQEKDVDCGLNAEQEIIVPKNVSNLIKDKDDNIFKTTSAIEIPVREEDD